MAKRERENHGECKQMEMKVHRRPRTIRRAAHEAQRVIDEYTGDSCEIEPDRAPRVHWRKRLAAAQKLDRKKTHKIGCKPGNADSCHLLATLPVPPQLSPLPQQLQFPAPLEVVDPDMVMTTPKLRQHHHEFLSEYHQHQLEVAAAIDSGSPAANQAAPLERPKSQPQKAMKLSTSLLPQLQSSSSRDATDVFDAEIAALLKEASATFAPMQLSEAATPAFPPLQETVLSESSQSIGVASSSPSVHFPRMKANKGTKDCEEGDAQSDNNSDASTILCQSTVRPTLDRSSSSSSMWWLPSNTTPLSFASCMAA